RRVAPGRRDPRAPPCGAARARAVPRSGPAARAGRGSSPPEMSSPGVRLPNRTTYRPEEYGGRYAGQVASPDPGKEARKPHALSCARLLRGARPPGGARPRHASPGGAVPRPRVLGRAVRHREREPGRRDCLTAWYSATAKALAGAGCKISIAVVHRPEDF